MDKNELIAEVSRCLKTVRAEYDFSQTQMASILGISKKSLVETEKKRRNLTWPECVAFVTLFSSSSILQNSFGGEMSDMMKAIAFNGIQPIYPKTLGGKIWWKNIREEKGYRLQQNIISSHYRILDSQDGRIISSLHKSVIMPIFENLIKEEDK